MRMSVCCVSLILFLLAQCTSVAAVPSQGEMLAYSLIMFFSAAG